jgi:hypothetical protein
MKRISELLPRQEEADGRQQLMFFRCGSVSEIMHD